MSQKKNAIYVSSSSSSCYCCCFYFIFAALFTPGINNAFVFVFIFIFRTRSARITLWRVKVATMIRSQSEFGLSEYHGEQGHPHVHAGLTLPKVGRTRVIVDFRTAITRQHMLIYALYDQYVIRTRMKIRYIYLQPYFVETWQWMHDCHLSFSSSHEFWSNHQLAFS